MFTVIHDLNDWRELGLQLYRPSLPHSGEDIDRDEQRGTIAACKMHMLSHGCNSKMMSQRLESLHGVC